MPFRRQTRKIETEQSFLKIPDASKPPSPDGIVDYTILELDSDSSRDREIDRITQMAREGVYRKNLILLRKERNLLIAVQHEQLGNYEFASACYERAAVLAERLELFDESKLFRDKAKALKKHQRKTGKTTPKKRKSKDKSHYTRQELEIKSILPKGITIPIVDRKTAENFKELRMESEEEEDDLF